MSKYASQIKSRWVSTAPKRTAALEDPETFFQDLGEQVLQRVNQLSIAMESTVELSDDYLQRAGQLTVVQRQAEEIAMSELDWPEPELSLKELREEWEATSTREEALTEWAASLETAPAEDELERLSAEWMLPTEFLRSLATATNPWTFSAEHSATISESQNRRFQRYLEQA